MNLSVFHSKAEIENQCLQRRFSAGRLVEMYFDSDCFSQAEERSNRYSLHADNLTAHKTKL